MLQLKCESHNNSMHVIVDTTERISNFNIDYKTESYKYEQRFIYFSFFASSLFLINIYIYIFHKYIQIF